MESRPASEGFCDSDDALRAEWRALRESIREARERAGRHHALAEGLESQVARDEHVLVEIEELLELRPQLRIEHIDRRLGGRRLCEVAVELLARERGFGEPVHYRQWFALLRRAGHEVAGKDPLASFLAQVSRAPEVERLGERSGIYRLRAAAQEAPAKSEFESEAEQEPDAA